MVFAAALMVALVSRYNMTEMFSQEDFAMVKNPGKENMEPLQKKAKNKSLYTFGRAKLIWQQRKKESEPPTELENGDIIYVPE